MIHVVAASRISCEQQAEDQRLREGRREKLIHISNIVTIGFGASEKRLIEISANFFNDLAEAFAALGEHDLTD